MYWLLDPASAGAYFIASRLANMFATVLSAVHNYATRRIPALYFSGRFDELSHILKLMAEVVLLCILAGILVIGFGAETILGAFGPAFAAQKWTLIILTMGTVIYAAGGPAAAVLMIAGHGGRYPWVVAANMILRFTGFSVLIPLFQNKMARLKTSPHKFPAIRAAGARSNQQSAACQCPPMLPARVTCLHE